MTTTQHRMDSERKAEWVAALRSGEYQQARGALARKDDENGTVRYCCLGVACDLAAKAGIIGEPQTESDFEDDKLAFTYEYETGHGRVRETATLPRPVRTWLGLDGLGSDAHNPMVQFQFDTEEQHARYPLGQATLAEINDEGYDFNKIADLIEENF